MLRVVNLFTCSAAVLGHGLPAGIGAA